MSYVLASDDGPEDGLYEHEEALQHHEGARRQTLGCQAVEGAPVLVVVDLRPDSIEKKLALPGL